MLGHDRGRLQTWLVAGSHTISAQLRRSGATEEMCGHGLLDGGSLPFIMGRLARFGWVVWFLLAGVGCSGDGEDNSGAGAAETGGEASGAGGLLSGGGSGGTPIGGQSGQAGGGAGGTAQGGSGGNAEAGTAGFGVAGLAEGCLSVVVSLETIEFDESFGVTALNGGVWRTESGLHVGWRAPQLMPDDSSRPRVLVATFDPVDGSQTDILEYDVLPANARSNNSNYQGMCGTDTELFATSMRSWDEESNPRNQSLLIGRLDDEAYRLEVDLGWPSGEYDVTDIGWDGEAFAVHSRNNGTGEIFVARVSPEGEVLLPLTKYGGTASPGGTPLGYHMSTDPVSGMSYLFDTPSTGRFLSGHDRGGAPPSWADGAPLNVLIPELLIGEGKGAANGNLSTDSEGGAWLTWYQDAPGLQRYENVAAHVTAAGQVDQTVKFGLATQLSPAIIAVSPTEALVAPEELGTMTLYRIEGSTVTSSQILMQDWDDYDIEEGRLDLRVQTGFAWRDEHWMWFTESRIDLSPVIHILKVKDGCRYVPATVPATE